MDDVLTSPPESLTDDIASADSVIPTPHSILPSVSGVLTAAKNYLFGSKKSPKKSPERNSMAGGRSDIEMTDESGAEYESESDKKRVKGDERYKTWRRTALMIWGKIADHRAGNRFLKPVKGDDYLAVIKQPMCLDQVKSRIRDGTTRTTAEFHRDVLHVLVNAIMFNPEDSELHQMATEMRDFVDLEMQSLLVYSNSNAGQDNNRGQA